MGKWRTGITCQPDTLNLNKRLAPVLQTAPVAYGKHLVGFFIAGLFMLTATEKPDTLF